MKLYRFFFHYRRSTGGMTVHFKGKCYPCKNGNCDRACNTKYSETQPKLVLQEWCETIIVKEDTIQIK